MQVAGFVGDGGDILLVAYGELGEGGAVVGTAEGFLGQDVCGNLAGGIELGYLVVFLNHPEAAVGVGIDLGGAATFAAVSISFTGGVLQRDGVHIVVAATVLDFEVYDFVGSVFGEPYTAVVERSAECYGSTADDSGSVFLYQYARFGCIVVPDVNAEVLGGCDDIGSDELIVGYSETAEFAECATEVIHRECTFVLARLGIENIHCNVAPVFAVEDIEVVVYQCDIAVGRCGGDEAGPARGVVLVGGVYPFLGELVLMGCDVFEQGDGGFACTVEGYGDVGCTLA